MSGSGLTRKDWALTLCDVTSPDAPVNSQICQAICTILGQLLISDELRTNGNPLVSVSKKRIYIFLKEYISERCAVKFLRGAVYFRTPQYKQMNAWMMPAATRKNRKDRKERKERKASRKNRKASRKNRKERKNQAGGKSRKANRKDSRKNRKNSRKASRKDRKASRKNRKNSRKNSRKASRKNRMNRKH
jgi:hypothetical protein